MLNELEEANQGTLKKMKTFISQARRRTNLLVASVQQASACIYNGCLWCLSEH